MKRAAFLILACLTLGGEGFAKSVAMPLSGPRVVTPGKQYIFHSESLAGDVHVRVADSIGAGDGRGAVTAYVFAPPVQARLIEVLVRERRLNSANYGAVVISVEAVIPIQGIRTDLLRRALDASDPLSAKFERFVVEELRPFIAARWNEKGPVVVAGSGLGGQFALRLAVKHPDFAKQIHVDAPQLGKRSAALLIGMARRGNGKDEAAIDVNYRRSDLEDPEGLDRLVDYLEGAGHYLSVNYHEQTGDGYETGPIPEAVRAADFIVGNAMVPPS